MPSNQQRREAERLRLQRQLEQRREREVSRRRATLIISVVATLALIAGVMTVIAVYGGGSSAPAAGPGHSSSVVHGTPTPSAPPQTPTPQAPSSSSAPPLAAPKACVKLRKKTVHFDGVTVRGATDFAKQPKVTSHSATDPTALECADLVVGKGKPAGPNSTVSVQYTGVLYRNGTMFDSSYAHGGKPISFPLNRVIPGFKQGIGGAGKVAPMRVGGRRLLILPATLAYGSSAAGSIPANSTLVFVVDLTKVSG